jgi:putative SOS response-associated peptidase YedK
MCGRYGESKILEQVKGKVPFFRAESWLKPRYNIAPTQMVWAAA